MASEIFVAGSSAPDGVARSGGTGKSTGEMTMDANELRALADALDSYPPSGMTRAAAYLRALADAKPVAAVPAGWKPVPVEPTPEMLSAVGMMDGYDWHAPGCSPDADHANWYSAMIAAAPAAPQAEPCIGNDPTCPCQDGDACHYRDAADGTKGWPAPQAEPKREPLSDERIAEIQRAAYERAAQECIETAAELRRCADGCTDGRYDWKADGAADCADAIRALGRQ